MLHNKSPGYLITIEGVDGSGKTSLAQGIVSSLLSEGIKAFYMRQPGGNIDSFSNSVRTLLLSQEMHSMTETLLFLADRHESINNVIKPKVEDGFVVVCDRFNDSTVAYQGYGRGQNIEIVKSLIHFSGCNFVPDLTFLLDVTSDVSMSRRSNSDRIEEKSDVVFVNRVIKGFLEIAKDNDFRFQLIDGSLDKNTVMNIALEHIRKRFFVENFRK